MYARVSLLINAQYLLLDGTKIPVLLQTPLVNAHHSVLHAQLQELDLPQLLHAQDARINLFGIPQLRPPKFAPITALPIVLYAQLKMLTGAQVA
jgi:hypothetical protein